MGGGFNLILCVNQGPAVSPIPFPESFLVLEPVSTGTVYRRVGSSRYYGILSEIDLSLTFEEKAGTMSW